MRDFVSVRFRPQFSHFKGTFFSQSDLKLIDFFGLICRLENVSDVVDDSMPAPGQTLEDEEAIDDI